MAIILEPPDVGNWFPRYAYETPVLDTSDCFGDSICKTGGEFVIQESTKEKEKIHGEFMKSRGNDELGFVVEEKNSNVFTDKRKQQSSSKVQCSYFKQSISFKAT